MWKIIDFNYRNNYGHLLTIVLLLAAFWLMSHLVGTGWFAPMVPAAMLAAVYIFCVTFDKYMSARMLNLNRSAWKVGPANDIDSGA